MTNAARDENYVPTIIAALETNGKTIVRIEATPNTHLLAYEDGTTGTDHGPVNDLRDENSVHCWMAVSSSDGKTPVVLYSTSLGKLLMDSS